jgi:hypothetical protein
MSARARASVRRLVAAAVTTALNFLREHTSESCTRLCAVLCCITGCGSALGAHLFANAHPDHPETVAALGTQTAALIAAGCVALLTRSRVGDAVVGGGS